MEMTANRQERQRSHLLSLSRFTYILRERIFLLGILLASHKTELRVRYADTDQGGVVYNSNYLIFFEVGRTEMMRQLGIPYAQVESEGTILPVVEAHVNYIAPARYDDLLVIESCFAEVRRVRLKIETKIYHQESGQLLATGWVWLASIDANGNLKRLPGDLRKAIGH